MKSTQGAQPTPRPGLAIPIVLDGGWLAQVVIPRDMSRAEMLRMRRVLWTLAVPWREGKK